METVTPDTKFTVGIIGTGVGIRTHMAGFHLVDGIEIAGVVGSSVENTATHLRKAGANPALACDPDELFRRKPQLICLTSPPTQREEYIPFLRDYGGSLLVEKPVAINAKDAVEFYEALPVLQPKSFLNVQLRGLPAFQWIRCLVRRGDIGIPYNISLKERTSAFRSSTIADWQMRRSTGGGQVFAMGTHLVDLGIFLSGRRYADAVADIGDAFGITATPRGSWLHGRTVTVDSADETFEGSFRAGGCGITMFTTAISAGPRTLEFAIEANEGTIEFRFREGTGRVDVFTEQGHESLGLGVGGCLATTGIADAKLNSSIFRVAFPNYASEIVQFVKGESEGPNLATLQDAINNVRIIEALAGKVS